MRSLFQDTTERLLSEHASHPAHGEAGAWSDVLWRAIEDAGLPLALAAEEHGGVAADWPDLFPIAFACGRAGAPVPLVETIIANGLLSAAGLAPVEGPAAISAAVLRNDDGRLEGRLPDVAWGRQAKAIVCVAEGANGLALAAISPQAADEIADGANIAREPRTTLNFRAASPIAIAPLDPGWSPEALLFNGARARAAQIAGALDAVVELTIRYAGDRVQFGRSLSKFQAIQQQIAVLAENAALSYTCADRAFAGPPFSAPAAIATAAAKVVCNDAASMGAQIAHAVHGAIGFTAEHQLHQFTQRLWSWRGEFGSTSFWAARLGRQACARGAAWVWPEITRHPNAERT